MKLCACLVLAMLSLSPVLSFAQPPAIIFVNDEPLMTFCGGSIPLPDGTPVLIFHDPTFNGPSPDDYQPTVGSGIGAVNFNTFLVNGVAEGLGDGLFITDEPPWSPVDALPQPAFFYLLVCADGVYYSSSTFFVISGFTEIHFGRGLAGDPTWTCVDADCPDWVCVAPPPPTNLMASSNRCDGILLTWEHPAEDICGFKIYRGAANPSLIATIDSVVPPFSYLYATAQNGNSTYRVRAIRCCLDDTELLSPNSSPVVGTRIAGPPPTVLISATAVACGEVQLVLMTNTTVGMDSARIYRDGEFVGAMQLPLAGTPFNFFDSDVPPGIHAYQTFGWNAACGMHPTGSEIVAGSALFPPPVPSNFEASTDNCEAILLTWDEMPDVTEFAIYRGPVVRGIVLGTETSFTDTGTVGTIYSYSITSSNDECGEGEHSVPQIGMQAAEPTGPVESLDATQELWDHVYLEWDDIWGVWNYYVFRDGEEIGVAHGIPAYQDYTAMPGVTHVYRIGISQCDTSFISASVEGRRPPNNLDQLPFAAIPLVEDRTGIVDFSVSDLGEDGDFDIAYADMFADEVAILEAAGQLSYVRHVVDGDFDGACGVILDRLDGDSLSDLAAVGQFSLELRCYERQDVGPVYTVHSYANDMNGYSAISLPGFETTPIGSFYAITTEGELIWWETTGFFVYELLEMAPGTGGAGKLLQANLNGIGLPDVIVYSQGTGGIFWWDMTTVGQGTRRMAASAHFHASGVAAADLNHDDEMDLLAVTPGANGKIAWFENDGEENFTQHDIVSGLGYPSAISAADINLDGAMDFVVLLKWDNELSWWEGDGAGGFQRTVISDNFAQGRALKLLDVDSDGDTDILAAGQDGLILWRNDALFEGGSAVLARGDHEENRTRSLDAERTDPLLPLKYALTVYPNPFNASTTIAYDLPEAGNVSLCIYDLLGRRTAELTTGNLSAGRHAVHWTCPNCATGVYLAVLEAANTRLVQKVMLMK